MRPFGPHNPLPRRTNIAVRPVCLYQIIKQLFYFYVQCDIKAWTSRDLFDGAAPFTWYDTWNVDKASAAYPSKRPAVKDG